MHRGIRTGGFSARAVLPGRRAPVSAAWPGTALAFSWLMLLPPALVGQRTVPPGEVQTRVLLENEWVLVVELVYPPGSEAAPHAHAHPRTVYVVEGGSLELTPEGGEPVRVSLASGQALWRPAESHSVRNVGGTTLRVVETEVKPVPTPAPGAPRDDPPRSPPSGMPAPVR